MSNDPVHNDDSVHNPYHFVPMRAPRPGQLKRSDQLTGTEVTHDRYVPGTHSGRICCELTTVTPLFIGAGKEDEGESQGPVRVKPFTIDDEPALPASSLRGMISSLVEAATDSALRVLSQTPYSYRMTMQENLPALGEIIEASDGRLRLRPLALPMYFVHKGVHEGYRQIFSNLAPLKAYVNGYTHHGGARAVGFLATSGLRSASHQNQREFWYMKLPALRGYFSKGGRGPWLPDYDEELLYQKQTKKGERYELGFATNAAPLSEARWRELPAAEQTLFQRGILRILAIEDHATEIPTTKKHEMFLPYPERGGPSLVPINDDVLDRFISLARERHEHDKSFPMHLKGREDVDWGNPLRTGDLVFFDVKMHGAKAVVSEIGLSSIWRRAVGRADGEWATTHDFFRETDKNLLPLIQGERGQKGAYELTIAERLFGAVAHERDQGNEVSAFALAGRLRFSVGSWQGKDVKQAWETRVVVLKELANPKPPCPALYFRPRKEPRGGYIAKSELKPTKHEPQGRKFYLHANIADRGKNPWKTGLPKNAQTNRQAEVKPVAAGQRFRFHVDFDNLSREELGALCYALQPNATFHHKLGMGKSIGLGTVRIDPQSIQYVDRQRRYAEDDLLSTARYQDSAAVPPERHFSALRDAFVASMGEHAKSALALLGDPGKVTNLVRTPLVINGQEEQETYKWFVANDGAGGAGEFLRPLDSPEVQRTKQLPTLKRLPPKTRR